MDVVFIGNFVNDVIVKNAGGGVEKTTYATGGSVTYGTLAAAKFGLATRVLTNRGDDLPPALLDTLKANNIAIDGSSREGKNTSYKLYYDESYNRTLSLLERGYPIELKDVEAKIGKPDAIFFVPIAAEFDETLLIETVKQLKAKYTDDSSYHPIIAMDVQGFIRTFEGKRVLTRSTEEMIAKFKRLSELHTLGVCTVLKAEYAEAAAMVGPLSPKDAALQLRKDFGFTIVSVTMGPYGGYLSSSITGEQYVPTFKPDVVLDETGCGDTFLACTVLEMLKMQKERKHANAHGMYVREGAAEDMSLVNITGGQLLHAFLVGSAASSFLVQKVGPDGFATREDILKRISAGERTSEEAVAAKFSVTKYKPPKK